jgi:hypothetical protein
MAKEKGEAKLYKNKAWLYDQIRNQAKTSQQIADELGVHINTITKWRRTFNIPSDFSSEKIPASGEITIPKYEDVQKKIKEAGGIGIWAQKEAVELFCFSKYLLDQINKALLQSEKEGKTALWIKGLFKATSELSKCASQLKELMPSRSSIPLSDPTHRMSEEDEKAINILNNMLSNIKDETVTGETTFNGWYSPGEKVPIKMPHESNRN